MELRRGYKKTELGIIPEDWNIVTIDSISTVGRGRVINHKEIARSVNPKYPVYSSQTSNNGVMGYLDGFEFEGEYVTWTTDGANAGTVFYRNGRFNCTNVCGTIKLQGENPEFVALELAKFAPTHVSRHLGNPKLMNGVVKRIRIPLPSTKTEQERIAGALTDIDKLVGLLDQLIIKKQDIKLAAMQKLLTGQQRLPEFNLSWEMKHLDEIANIIDPHPSHRAPKEVPNGIPFVGIGDISPDGTIDNQSVRLVSPSVYLEHSKRYNLDHGLLGLGRVASIGKVVRLQSGSEPYVVSPTMAILHPKFCSLDFLFYLLGSRATSSQFDRISNGSTRQSVGIQVLARIEIWLPSDQAEQRAISSLFADMDAEIARLELRRTKIRELKQGMMQELLTGRTRLV
jgi:type I restriction enzyme S subunit